MSININENDFWKGKVSGSRNQIQNAIDVLVIKKQNNFTQNDLQEEICKQIYETLQKDLQKEEEQHRYCPY